jgi:hypothetical protein
MSQRGPSRALPCRKIGSDFNALAIFVPMVSPSRERATGAQVSAISAALLSRRIAQWAAILVLAATVALLAAACDQRQPFIGKSGSLIFEGH